MEVVKVTESVEFQQWLEAATENFHEMGLSTDAVVYENEQVQKQFGPRWSVERTADLMNIRVAYVEPVDYGFIMKMEVTAFPYEHGQMGRTSFRRSIENAVNIN